MGLFNEKDQARDISEDLTTLRAIGEGQSLSCPAGREHLRDAIQETAASLSQRVENGVRRLYKYETGDMVTDAHLNYYRNCCMCLGKCTGH